MTRDPYALTTAQLAHADAADEAAAGRKLYHRPRLIPFGHRRPHDAQGILAAAELILQAAGYVRLDRED